MDINNIRKQKFLNQQLNECNNLIIELFSMDFNIISLDIKNKILHIINILFDENKNSFLKLLLNKLKEYGNITITSSCQKANVNNEQIKDISYNKAMYYDPDVSSIELNEDINLNSLTEIYKIDKLFFKSYEEIIKKQIINLIELKTQKIDLNDYYNISDDINLIINNFYNKLRIKIDKILNSFDNSTDLKQNQNILDQEIIYKEFNEVDIIRLDNLTKYLLNQKELIKEYETKVYNALNFNKYINLKYKLEIESIINSIKNIYPLLNIDLEFKIEADEEIDKLFAESLQFNEYNYL